ncbi:hypothetical protein FRC04_009621 [Tulasnella sp. 424]|nr:hypothetical protein FRC04_009621 [Tulasnella sp. 424]KAG8975920.1 hypothetical protein FRC05_004851 [Tulasnella sp. 425]
MTEDTVTSTPTSVQSAATASNARGFQERNEAYRLPIDSEEHSRLDLQHEAVRLMVGGGIYQQPNLVQAALSPAQTHKRRILDVGAGSGKWCESSISDSQKEYLSTVTIFRAIEMAKEFPDAEVQGIDLVLPTVLTDPSRRVPSNCSFQIADANCDMDKFEPVFDVVQMRCVEAGIKDSDHFFYKVGRILRPKGVLLLVAANPQLVDDNDRIIPLQKPGDVGILGSNPNYTDVQIQEVLVPIAPWSKEMSGTERTLAELMQENHIRVLSAYKAALSRDGALSEELGNSMVEGVVKELRELPPAVHAYAKWTFATAVRAEAPWVARETPWQEPPGFDIYDYIPRPLPKD